MGGLPDAGLRVNAGAAQWTVKRGGLGRLGWPTPSHANVPFETTRECFGPHRVACIWLERESQFGVLLLTASGMGGVKAVKFSPITKLQL